MADIYQLIAKDFCCLQELTLNLSDRGLVVITGDNQDSDAADNNGSGKSTILKALTWGLYGETIDGNKHDEVIRWGQKKAEVTIGLRDGTDYWMVERVRKKGKPSLELSYVKTVKEGGKRKTVELDPFAGDNKEKQAKIVELLGLDFRGFCNTVLFGQGDVDRFFSSTDTARKETLHRVLRTDIYRVAEGWVRNKINRELAPRADEIESDMSNITGRLEEYDISELEMLNDEWEDGRKERIGVAEEEAKQADKNVKVVADEHKTKRGTLTAELKKEQGRVKELDVARQALEKAEKEYAKLLDAETEAQRATGDGERRSEVVRQLKRLEGDKCPTCTSPLTKGAPAKLRVALLAEKVELDKRIEKKNKLYTKARTAVGDYKDTLAGCKNDYRGLESAPSNLRGVERDLEHLDDATTDRKREAQRVADQQHANVKKLKEEKNPHSVRLAEASKRVIALKKEYDEKSEAHKAAMEELAHYEFWVKGFGVQGLPSLLLDTTMPYLTERANHYLETLADGDITVSFSTQRELKSKKGEMRDEIDVSWSCEGVPDVAPSNGQKRKLEVATDLALMDLVASREGSINLLLMDEVLDGLDEEGVNRVLRLLQELRSTRSSIFVVTHESGLAEAFEREVHVTKQGQASTVREVV